LKEQELQKVMIDFYNYDLSELKRDLATMVKKESEMIEREKEDKEGSGGS
jgi:hypothetical protein